LVAGLAIMKQMVLDHVYTIFIIAYIGVVAADVFCCCIG